jgi:hypothetical protein
MSASTLGKIALGLMFPTVGVIYLYQNQITSTLN